MENQRLGPTPKESVKTIYKMYTKKWITIHISPSGEKFSGQLSKIIDGYGLLSPCIFGEYNKKGTYIRKLSKKIISVPLKDAVFEPTTKKSLENYCFLLNEIDRKSVV